MINTEVPGIVWPDNDFPEEVLPQIIEASRANPLRLIMARRIIGESRNLWEIYGEQYSPSDERRTDQDLAIREGYAGVGHEIESACKEFYDREATVHHGVQAVKYLDISTGSNHFEALSGILYADIKRVMDRDILSLTIDPSGMDLLKIAYKRKQTTWDRIRQEILGEDRRDPEVIGHRIGMERYQFLYWRAVEAGAAKDESTSGLIGRRYLRVKRAIDHFLEGFPI